MRVCSYEDRQVAELEPLTLTRPAFHLLCGQTSLADKQYRYFNARFRGALVRPHLAALTRLADTTVAINDYCWLTTGRIVMVNARWLPPAPGPTPFQEANLNPRVGLVGDEVAYAVLDPIQMGTCCPELIDQVVQGWKATLPHRPAGGRMVQHLWDLVQHNGEQIVLDWELLPRTNFGQGILLPGFGPREALAIDPTARIDPLVTADTTQGPVVIAREAVVKAFSCLEGPCYIGPRTQLHGARIRAGTTLGPECRMGGEIEGSIVQGYSNKAHDGFLGHSYLGEWVNLGAGTQASNLRHDYGEVRVMANGRVVLSGQNKVGCFIGDHAKSGIGSLLNTGTNVGMFAQLLPSGGLLPRYVPAFSTCWEGELVENADVQGMLATAEVVMRRRGKALTATHRDLYFALFERTAAERRRALRLTQSGKSRRAS